MQPIINHYDGLDGTPAAGIALRGQAECISQGGEQAVGLHWSYPAITASFHDDVAGVIVWINQIKESKRIWLQLGYVLPQYRGKGVYSHLWGALIEQAQALDCRQIQSATTFDNHLMRDIAKKQGRVEFAVSMRFAVPKLARAL